jgi:hypothetical protein
MEPLDEGNEHLLLVEAEILSTAAREVGLGFG